MEGVECGVGEGELLCEMGTERGQQLQRLAGIGKMITETGVEGTAQTQSLTGMGLDKYMYNIVSSGTCIITCIPSLIGSS